MVNKKVWYGNEAIKMAAHMIEEVNGLNDLKVAEWLEYRDVNFINKCAKSHKKTLLHDYIEFIYYYQYEYLLDKHFPMVLINKFKELLYFYQVDYTTVGEFELFGIEDDELNPNDFQKAEEYANLLFIFFREQLGAVIIDDIFTVLFSNKHFLFEFNSQLMIVVMDLKLDNHPTYLKKNGVIKRSKYIPSWLKNGVFMRDKGRCQICGTDLKKILELDNQENYDHIIPLEIGGTNDPTNYQLTCEHCNKSKGARNMIFNNLATRFWSSV